MVRAMRGVMMRSMVGSFARFKNSTVLSMEPFSSKSCRHIAETRVNAMSGSR